ncbi:MAG: hypothetical protein WD226_01865 [Planctomycetota bacterium]
MNAREAFWPRLAERLAHEFGAELLDGLRVWTQLSDEALRDVARGATTAAPMLDEADALQAEVTAVGFLVGCLGAARGSDVLRARREQQLVEVVVRALERRLAARRGVNVTVGEGCPRFPGTSGDWRSALLIAWGLWRVEPGQRTLAGDTRTRLDFGALVAWDGDLAALAPPGMLCTTGLDFARVLDPE